MNIRDFQYIVAVDEHGHFGKAAGACFVSQPTLSGQIRKLEDYLGLDIFERTKRSVHPTPFGERIIEQAKIMLSVADQVHEIAAAMKDPLAGPLSLGAIPTIAPYLMPVIIPPLANNLPAVDLRLKEGVTKEIEKMLVDGRLDAAITATEPEPPQLTSIPLYDEPFWVALPDGHAFGREGEIDLADLTTERLLLLSEGHCLSDQVLSFYPSIRRTPETISTEETSLTTILALVGGGFGITLVPAMSLSGPWVTDAGIFARKENSGKALREVRLTFRKSFSRMALIEKVADIIAEAVPGDVVTRRR